MRRTAAVPGSGMGKPASVKIWAAAVGSLNKPNNAAMSSVLNSQSRLTSAVVSGADDVRSTPR